jgi:hypothetical protein
MSRGFSIPESTIKVERTTISNVAIHGRNSSINGIARSHAAIKGVPSTGYTYIFNAKRVA